MALIDGLLTHQADLYVNTLDLDARGGDEVTASTIVRPAVECVIDQPSHRMVDIMAGKGITFSHVGIFGMELYGVIRENMVLTNVSPIGEPGQIQRDDYGAAGMLPTQYLVMDVNAPNLEDDHLEVALQRMQGRRAMN